MGEMALAAKTNIELDELLQERPTQSIYPREPVEEQPTSPEPDTVDGKGKTNKMPPGDSQID